MISLSSCSVFLLLLVSNFAVDAVLMPKIAIPNVAYKLTDVTECDSDKPLKFEFYLENIDLDGYKSFTGSIFFPEDINDKITYSVRVDKYNNEYWEEDIYSREGNLCEESDKFVPKLLPLIKSSSKPEILSKGCLIPAGNYTLEKFEIPKDTAQLPFFLFGRIRFTFLLYNKDDESFLCGLVEGECNS